MADRAYIGPETDTPNVRRITPARGRLTTAQQAANQEIGRHRVPIECFFGRMQSLWRITAECYRNSHIVFDLDFDNCALLTNEHIRYNQLNPTDEEFSNFVFATRESKRIERERKRRHEYERYVANRRARNVRRRHD